MTLVRGFPSIVIVPLSGFIKVATKPAIVDLPDPELPTRAMVSPAFASKLYYVILLFHLRMKNRHL